MLEERDEAVGDQVAGGLVSGDREQEEEEVDLEPGETLAVDLGLTQHADQVVARVGPLLLGELGRVRVELHRRDRGVLFGDAVLGVFAADHAVRPVEQLVAVLLGDAHEVGDDLQWQLGGDVDDEVALTPLGDSVEDLAGAAAHRVLERTDHPGCEALVDEQSVARVQRRIHVEHEQALLLERLLGHVPQEDGST